MSLKPERERERKRAINPQIQKYITPYHGNLFNKSDSCFPNPFTIFHNDTHLFKDFLTASLPVSFLSFLQSSANLNKLFWSLFIPMDTEVRATTKPHGIHGRAHREQASHPTLQISHLRYKGKTLLPREVPSQLCPVEEKRSYCVNILWGEGKHQRQDREGLGSTNSRILVVHLDSKPQPRCQAHVVLLLREEVNKGRSCSGAETEKEPGHGCTLALLQPQLHPLWATHSRDNTGAFR